MVVFNYITHALSIFNMGLDEINDFDQGKENFGTIFYGSKIRKIALQWAPLAARYSKGNNYIIGVTSQSIFWILRALVCEALKICAIDNYIRPKRK